jgi:hypothetical protein
MAYESASFRVQTNSISQDFGHPHTQETQPLSNISFDVTVFLLHQPCPGSNIVGFARSSELTPNFEHGAGPTNI